MQSNLHSVEPEELMAYLDGELQAERAAEVAEHIQECRECQILGAEFKSITEGLTAWEVPSPAPELSIALTSALDEREAEPQKGFSPESSMLRRRGRLRRFAPWVGGALAGAVVTVLIAFSLIFTPSRGEHEPSQMAARTETAAAPTSAPAQGVVGGVPGGVPAGATGSDRDRLVAQYTDSLSEPQRVELMKRKQAAEISQNLEVTGAAPVGSPTASPAALPTPPMILRTAQVTVVTQDLDKARAGMDQIVQRFGGYVGDLSASAPADGPRKLTATLRIPSGQLDTALAEVKKLGRVESESQSGQDVTAQYVDLEARLGNSRNTERRLIDLLNQRTGKLSDVLEVETELSRVREEIERMEGERRLMSKQVEFATVTATVTEEYKAPARPLPDSLGARFHNAVVDGYQSVVNFIIGVALFLIADGPMLLVWAVILFFPARWAWRKWRKSQADEQN